MIGMSDVLPNFRFHVSAPAPRQVGRPRRELLGQFDEVQVVLRLERFLANDVLLEMVKMAKADRPSIGGFQSQTSVGAAANMSALDGPVQAATHGTAMPPDP